MHKQRPRHPSARVALVLLACPVLIAAASLSAPPPAASTDATTTTTTTWTAPHPAALPQPGLVALAAADRAVARHDRHVARLRAEKRAQAAAEAKARQEAADAAKARQQAVERTTTTTTTTAPPPPPTSTAPSPPSTGHPSYMPGPGQDAGPASPCHDGGGAALSGDPTLPPAWVANRESHGDYCIRNSAGSTACGAWQIVRGTWKGYGGYPDACSAPPDVQDAKARELWAGGRGCGNWGRKACGG